jgi:hypothetical protein
MVIFGGLLAIRRSPENLEMSFIFIQTNPEKTHHTELNFHVKH